MAEEFSSIWVFHLRGNQRTSGEQSRKEGGKIFGSGSRAPIAISLLVKNPEANQHGRIQFHDIGDYLSREEKLQKISAYGSVESIAASDGWVQIMPDAHGDWLTQRDEGFQQFIPLGDKLHSRGIFDVYSRGVMTSKDAWLYNSSEDVLIQNAQKLISTYGRELERYRLASVGLAKGTLPDIEQFFEVDPSKISWDGELKVVCARGRPLNFQASEVVQGLYRPFTKQWYYGEADINLRLYQMPRIFPDAMTKNRVISVAGVGARSFSVLMADKVPCLDSIEKGQCFPLYVFEEVGAEGQSQHGASFLEDGALEPRRRRTALTDKGLAHFEAAYPGEGIGKEDVFYYVYGLLHSPGYRERYADNLVKELPRIPCVKTAADFWAFSQAGRDLAELHLNYETVAMYPAKIDGGGKKLTDADYRVEKMRHGKKGKDKDLSTVHYNSRITVSGIPVQAYDYVVNGKPAIDWVIERQCVKTDKASGIVNDANDWAIETMQNPKYPLELLLRMVTVSLETMNIVHALPKLDI